MQVKNDSCRSSFGVPKEVVSGCYKYAKRRNDIVRMGKEPSAEVQRLHLRASEANFDSESCSLHTLILEGSAIY